MAYIGAPRANRSRVLREPWMLVEESTVPTAHVAAGQHPLLVNRYHAQPVETVHVAFLVNPL
jgi:hypothetical protein